MVYVHRCSAIRKKSSDRRGKVHREGGWSIMVEYNRSQVRSRIFCFLLPNNCDCEGVLQKVSLAIRLGVAMAPFKECYSMIQLRLKLALGYSKARK